MKLFIIAVRDRAAGAYLVPQFVTSIGAAIRSFSDEVNRADPGNSFYNHASDFDLFELGHFDDDGAVFTLLERPRQVAIGKDLVKEA